MRTTQGSRDIQEAREQSSCGKNQQRDRHPERRLMRHMGPMVTVFMVLAMLVDFFVILMLGPSVLAEEDHKHLAEHVKRGEPGGDTAQGPENWQRISSLEKKPANGGIPDNARVETRKVR